uniref:Uncharacterized protein n=1 Tax=Tetraselmis chuii TaxID=63592 RepID=A0A7S1SPP8_9CHLO|mmetsp:Transcript_22924/g.40799  ORF Transcript_22924/g.40799 Transcript_22924/m.40799 type:complete len:217 (+) Transcript_22924:89-739(+)
MLRPSARSVVAFEPLPVSHCIGGLGARDGVRCVLPLRRHLTPSPAPQWTRTASKGVLALQPGDDGYGMYVPADALGGDTPENKAAKSLSTLMTYVAVRIVMEQMSGDRHRSPMYNRLRDYINDEAPIREGREWLEGLLRHPENEMRMVALRIIETREIYVDKVFDWDDLKEGTLIKVKQDNNAVKREWMMECMSSGGDGDSCAPQWPEGDSRSSGE